MPRPFRAARLGALAATLAVVAAGGLATASPAAAAPTDRIDLRVLVLSQGGPEEAIAATLDAEGVPYTRIDLNSPTRTSITASYLQDTVSGRPRAKFQSVVLPNETPNTVTAAELTALANFERSFGIREVLAYTYPTPAVGLDYPAGPGTFVGTLDGRTATATPAATGGAFNYLRGPVPIEDGNPSVSETYGYATRTTTLPAGQTFTPYLTLPVEGSATPGVLGGVFSRDGRESFVLTASANEAQGHFRLFRHGLLTWMTKGVHLGYNRNYFNVDVDDIFGTDNRWSPENNCTPEEDCPAGVTTTGIRMTAADVDTAVAWQNRQGIKLNMVFNGFGSDDYVEENRTDPLLTRFRAVRSQFPWINHTYEHLYLGCQQNNATIPWTCTRNAAGAIQWVPRSTIDREISQNRTWALLKGFSMDSQELVTGEHSGLFLQPQQPQDNPNFVAELNANNVRVTASDASRDPNPRQVGNARTLPRYPMSVYFNVGTRAEMMDEYNWIYTSRANGGSGICEDNPQTVTCITPKTAAEFDSYLVPLEASIDMRHITGNDARPHYVHQSNLAEQRLLYPMLDEILRQYRNAFAANTPLLQPGMKEALAALDDRTRWAANKDRVTAYSENGQVRISAPSGVEVPVTAPTGTQRLVLGVLPTAWGTAYQGELSSWVDNGTILRLR